jgi:hypothetical protein
MYQQMLAENPQLFATFGTIHNKYVLEPNKYQTEFNQVGQPVVDVITEYENKLCKTSEKGQYAKYSHTLADKFHDLVRADFPKIDDVGIEVEYSPTPPLPSIPRFKIAQKTPSVLDRSAEDIVQDTLDTTLSTLKKTPL